MCGIVGVASATRHCDVAVLQRMRDTLQHRGPDDAGIWHADDHAVGLGHRRLAIIDLSPAGHQPMCDESCSFWVTFNGEIYNYLQLRDELRTLGHNFRTNSDTEVILEAYKAWGTDCVRRFDGMFAFALYDVRKRHIYIARDCAGEKPLFYSHSRGVFIFASELKALMKHPDVKRCVDVDSLNYYLAYGCVPGAKCILEGIQKLPPAHVLTYELDADRTTLSQYWDLPDPSTQDSRVETEQLVFQLKKRLLDSLRLRMIADVSVGVLLSGGLDSSLITALSAEASTKRVKTFTISIPGHPRYDESRYARIVSAHFGTEHTEEEVSPASVDILPELARQFDEPLGDSSIIPTYLLSRAVRQHVKVALSGDGGDELFGGYLHYNLLLWLSLVRAVTPSLLRRVIGRTSAQLLPTGVRGRNHLIGLSKDARWNIAHLNMYFDTVSRSRLLTSSVQRRLRSLPGPEEYKSGLCSSRQTVLQQATTVDFRSTMVDDYLVKVDRSSMLASLEVRAPFLDQNVIRFAFAHLPDRLRAGRTGRKILLRELAQRILPPGLDVKRKHGLSLPLASWFRGEWHAYAQAILSEISPAFFNTAAVAEILKSHKAGMANSHRVFSLIMFELWRREYNVTIAEA
jgi:asparagine synthase (glutamine-hydrolysing)